MMQAEDDSFVERVEVRPSTHHKGIVIVPVKLGDDQAKRLDEIKAPRKVNRGHVIREAVDRYLDRVEHKCDSHLCIHYGKERAVTSIPIRSDQLKKLNGMAARQNKSRSHLIREAIECYLAEEKAAGCG